jgi:hypothetical protein
MVGLVLMTKPFQHVLGLIPKGVMAGLFVDPSLTLQDSADWSVVYGYRRTAWVWSDRPHAVPHPGSVEDLTYRPAEQGPEIQDSDLPHRRADRLRSDLCHHTGETGRGAYWIKLMV